MSKPILVFQSPVATRSGYGDHARSIAKSLIDLDKYDVKFVPTRWGTTPQDQLNVNNELHKKILSNIIFQLDRKPDVFIQMSVSNEFKPVGEYNIGITAGVETDKTPVGMIEGANNMNLIIVPSQFTKDSYINSAWQKIDNRTRQSIGTISLQREIEVLLEGIDSEVFTKKTDNFLKDVKTNFNFLFVGHWLKGDVGHDRKDVGMLLKTFCSVFSSFPKDNQPGLILKTSMAGFSLIERDEITNRIEAITSQYGDKCPPIHLVFGDLSEEEMSNLYHDDKVKAMVSFTKGEGFGRPLAEFALTDKPIITSNWSGHTDFLPVKHTHFLDGELKNVHPSAADGQFLTKEASWFNVDYSNAAKTLVDVYTKYEDACKKSKGLKNNIINNFTMEHQTKRLGEILDKYVKVKKKVELSLPSIDKL